MDYKEELDEVVENISLLNIRWYRWYFEITYPTKTSKIDRDFKRIERLLRREA